MNFDRELLLAVALDNAIKHGGKASSKAVLGKILSLRPQYKENIKELMKYVQELVEYVNSLSYIEVKKKYEEYESLIPERRYIERVYKLPPLPNAKVGNVVTRFAPNPDFVLHLGSLRPLIISYVYAREYKGKFILRFEDTDPRTKRPELEYYEKILDDIRWLGIKPDEVYYQSDRIELYYNVARDLILKGRAYVCRCTSEEFSEYVLQGRPCPHRGQSVDENIELFEKMLEGVFKEGEAVLRIKTDLKHPNPSVRDWVAMRIIDVNKYPHPRTGSRYYVWPLYNFSCAIDDHYMGVTHVFRGVEHKINEEKQKYIYLHMGWSEPIYVHHGRLAIPGGVLSKSKILKGIKEGIYEGIDDPRLLTVASLKRRGFHPEALKNVILRVGISSSNAIIDFSLLASENKKIVDKYANRFFAVREPFKLKIPFREEIKLVKIRMHPDYLDRGYRIFKMKSPYQILYLDFEDKKYILGNNIFRLIGLGNYKLRDYIEENVIEAVFIDNDVKRAIKKKYRFIHWVPIDYAIEAVFIYPGNRYKGYVEKNILQEKVGRVVQLERLGYFRIEDLTKDSIKIVFGHN